MDEHRRDLLKAAFAGASVLTLAAPEAVAQNAPQPRSANGADQTAALQQAIDRAARSRTPLVLQPGIYRTGALRLAPGLQMIGVRNATRLVFTGAGESLLAGDQTHDVLLTGLSFEGGHHVLPDRRGLIDLRNAQHIRIVDCDIIQVAGTGIWLEQTSGDIRSSTFRDIRDSAIVSFDDSGLIVSQNEMRDIGDNGIEILRHQPGDDSSQIIDNRIANVTARKGGSGQHGNGIVIYRAHNCIARGNRIHHCDYSGVRANSASNVQILGNSIVDAREVAIYSEFSFEGAIIAHNSVDGAALGVSVCNFNEGGRLAVVQGNLIRNLKPQRPAGSSDGAGGIGIYIEADTLVSGNNVEDAPLAAIMAGWGRYLRDVNIHGNILRKSGIGIALSVAEGAGAALISDNIISGTQRGAIVGMDHARPVTTDLAQTGAPRYAHLEFGRNLVR